MSVKVNTDLNVRDFRFELSDSCNCCWSRTPTSETLIYVTTSGALEKYDFKKAPLESVAHTRSLTHLLSILHSLVAEEDKERIINNVVVLTGFHMTSDKDMPLTLGKMEKINTAIETITGSSK